MDRSTKGKRKDEEDDGKSLSASKRQRLSPADNARSNGATRPSSAGPRTSSGALSSSKDGEKKVTAVEPIIGVKDYPFKSRDWLVRKEQERKPRIYKALKQIVAAENYEAVPPNIPTYVNIEAPPSLFPAKRYCDVTGFPAKYTDPKTKLRYASASLFSRIRNMPDETVQTFLEIRKANVVLK
mmetsp:Transcript_46198/g.75378  ORF Transcript_46198/g.75378 Transcript_46198/m.75378 type:complete len:183 (+) Transcript_46198:142-690(+)